MQKYIVITCSEMPKDYLKKCCQRGELKKNCVFDCSNFVRNGNMDKHI